MRRSRVWSPTRMCKLLWNSISFSLICSWRVCLWVCVWLWCIIAENVRGYRFRFDGTNGWWRRLFSYCLLPIVHPLATCVWIRWRQQDGERFRYLLCCSRCCLFVSCLYFVDWYDSWMVRQKQQRSTRSSFALLPFPRVVNVMLLCVSMCGWMCYHMKSKQKRKEIC